MIRPMRNRLASLAIAGFLASSALVPSAAAAAPQGHWSQEALNLAAQRGLLEGAADSIDPDETVTRGMFVTLLGRLDGGELPSEAPTFSDVPAGAGSAPYVAWAQQISIVQGVSAQAFAPEQAVTRRQAALLLDRYFTARSIQLESQPVTPFADRASLDAQILPAVERMQQAGILTGRPDGRFDPDAPITYGEAAALLDRAWQAVTAHTSQVLTIPSFDGYPLEGKLRMPCRDQVDKLVIYVNGSGPNTYDNHRALGSLEFNYFDLFARQCAREGAAFFSYSTRGVSPGSQPPLYDQIDEEAYQSYLPQNSVQDVEQIILALRQDPRLQHAAVYLLGWSEGAMIAPKVALRGNAPVDALLLAGYPNGTMVETLDWQQTGGSSMVTYCLYFDTDGDGAVSPQEYEADPYGVREALGLGDTPFSGLDLDQNGRLEAADFAILLAPSRQQLYDAIERGDDAWLAANYSVRLTSAWFRAHRDFPPNRDMMTQLDLPIVIFQGEADANVPVQGCLELQQAFQQAGKTNLTVHTYPQTDHDLNYSTYLLTGSLPQGLADLFHTVRTLPVPAER